MKDGQKDIYQKPPPREEEPKAYPEVDLSPVVARSLTRRRIVLFFVIVLALLGVSTWLVQEQSERSRRDDLLDRPVEDPLSYRLARTNVVSSVIVSPDATSVLEGVDRATPQAVPQTLDGPRVAQAMGFLRVAERYLREREFDQAEIQVRRALAIWPDMNAAQRSMGYIYTQRGQFDEAIVMLNNALKTDPANPETYNMLAAAYMHKGEMSHAEELLHTALDIRPDYVFAILNMGMLHLASGRYDLAADYLGRSVEQLPDHPNIRNNLAVCLLRIGHYDEARQQLQHLVDVHPTVPAWYF